MTDYDGESHFATRLAGIPPHDRHRSVLRLVLDETAALLGRDADSVDPECAYQDYGYNSLAAVELTNRLARASGFEIPLTILFDHPTPLAVADYLLSRVDPGTKTTAVVDEALVAAREDDPIAIVGMACRYPGGVRSAAELWELVDSGGDAVASFPTDRGWDLDMLSRGEPDQPGTSQTTNGGFLYDAANFDADFFGISPREAIAMDPQHRLLLETTWEALEDAGIDPTSLRRTPTGVFVGLSTQDYAWLAGESQAELDGQWGIGTAGSVASGRIAYALGLEGVALTVDTACSSSLVALHYARKSLRDGECSLAVVGGVAVLATPTLFTEFSRQRGLAPDGRCKSFSEDADGTGWAEGVGLVVVERLSDAHRHGHDVLALVRGSAVNQDGRSNGLTAPHGPSQAKVIQRALKDADLDPSEVDVVEAHGTGTSLGDPIEANAVLDTYGKQRPPEHPLWLGSMKSNIGHSQAASGVGGVIKMVMALWHERLPATLHLRTPTSKVDWSRGSVSLLTEPVSWPHGDRPRRCGVSAFGISGTNAHVILEEPEVSQSPEISAHSFGGALPWLLTAKSQQALREQAERLKALVHEHPEFTAADIGYSLATTRATWEHRAIVIGKDRAELCHGLDAVEGGRGARHVVTDTAQRSGKIALLFTGQGSQRPEMGRELARTYPVFAEALDAVCGELDQHLDRPVRDVLFASAGSSDRELIHQTGFTQATLFAFEVALFRLVESWGVQPDYVMGHSIGELAAAHLAGMMSLADTCALVAARGRLMQNLPCDGAMVAVQASEAELAPTLEDEQDALGLAAVNGPSSVVISGREQAVDACARRWAELGRRTERLQVSHAFHSPLMDPMLAEFADAARSLSYQTPRLPLVSNVTGAVVTGQEMYGADYWVSHARRPVRFLTGMRRLEKAGVTDFLELGPRAVLSVLGKDCLSEDGRNRSRLMAAQRPGRSESEALVTAVSELHAHGGEADLRSLFANRGGRRVRLPSYPFQRRRFWPEEVAVSGRRMDRDGVTGKPARQLAEPDASREEDMVTLICRHVATILGHDSEDAVDPERSLLDLGLDSMGALEVHKRLVNTTGYDFSPAVLVDQPTPAALADYLSSVQPGPGSETRPTSAVPAQESMAGPPSGTMMALLRHAHATDQLDDTVPLLSAASRFRPQFGSVDELAELDVTLVADGPSLPRLLCVPSFLAGSGPHQFARLAAGFPRRRNVTALTLPGFRPGDPLPGSWDALIDALARATRKSVDGRPFALVGYSIGGVLAHALAATLEQDATPPSGVILIDTHEPGHSDQSEVFAWAMGQVLERDEQLLAISEDNALAMGSYLRVFGERSLGDLITPSLLLCADSRPSEPVPGWNSWESAECMRAVIGDHFSIMEEHAQTTAKAVDTWLANTVGDDD